MDGLIQKKDKCESSVFGVKFWYLVKAWHGVMLTQTSLVNKRNIFGRKSKIETDVSSDWLISVSVPRSNWYWKEKKRKTKENAMKEKVHLRRQLKKEITKVELERKKMRNNETRKMCLTKSRKGDTHWSAHLSFHYFCNCDWHLIRTRLVQSPPSNFVWFVWKSFDDPRYFKICLSTHPHLFEFFSNFNVNSNMRRSCPIQFHLGNFI